MNNEKFELKKNGELIETFVVENRNGILSKVDEYLANKYEGVRRINWENSLYGVGWNSNHGVRFTLHLIK